MINYVINQLEKNLSIYEQILKDVDEKFIRWKPRADKWCLLEIVCHLYDEERLDFRFRTQWCLEKPGKLPPQFNPLNWVIEHKYMEQEYAEVLANFIKERKSSIVWLSKLNEPNWDNFYLHPKLGETSAKHYLDNWLAHDYLHIRQIMKLKFDYLKDHSGNDLQYAGIW